MKILSYSLGAAQEVTGSKHILEIDGRSIMIDCGAFQGKRQESDKKNREFSFAPDKLETVILTHAHYDHCGLLPVLSKNGFKGEIYATPATRDLANLVMMDSAKIQARDAEFLKKQAKKKGEKFGWKPLFNEEDCVKVCNLIRAIGYNLKVDIAQKMKHDISLEFFDAGHILGSSLAMVTIKKPLSFVSRLLNKKPSEKDEVRVLYTGDLGRKAKPIIRPPATDFPAPDYIFMESTYGNRLHENSEIAMNDLEKVVRRAVDQKGKIIIPTFAIERAQELVYFLHILQDKKRIPQIPIYVDSPMASNATGIFQLHQECYDEATKEAFLVHHKNPFGFNSLQFIQSVDESKQLNNIDGPMIILSADGMCEAGRILYHLANNISDPKNIILIVGYMSENTLGRKIRDGAEEVKILGDMYKVKATVKTINAFSAHADYNESIDWLNSIDTSRLKKIFLVHGEKKAQEEFQQHLNEAGYKDVQIVKYGESYELK